MLSITLEDYHSLSLKYTRMLLTEFTGCSSYIMYLHEVPVLDTILHCMSCSIVITESLMRGLVGLNKNSGVTPLWKLVN